MKTFKISFPPFAVNNENQLQSDIQHNQNLTLPIIFSSPYLPLCNLCSYMPNLLALNMNNQNCEVKSSTNENKPTQSFEIPQQLKKNLIDKMMNIKPNLNQFSSQNFYLEYETKNQNVNNFQLPEINKKNQRIHFSKEEDEKIVQLVNKFGKKNWSIIASFIKGRTAKQCRDRYSNYLSPEFFQGEWSKEEDELLIKLYNEKGSKWSIIQTYLPNRSSNSIKNRWYYFLRKNKEDEKIVKKNKQNDKIESDVVEEKELHNGFQNIENDLNAKSILKEENMLDKIDDFIDKENELINNFSSNCLFEGDFLEFI